MATIATVGFSNCLGALGTDRPLMNFLPAAPILVLAASFVSHQRMQDSQRRAFDQECRLAELSVTDTLTGARSRADFLQQAENAAAHARATGAPLTLLYLDIDHSKRLNDLHGHAAGNAVLRGMAGLRNGESVAQTLHRADLAMLRARQEGRDTVRVAA